MSVNTTNPSVLFGGTWEQIKDKFLLSAGDTYSNGSTGGASTVSLTTSNMPSHSHSFSGSTNTDGNHTHTVSTLTTSRSIWYNPTSMASMLTYTNENVTTSTNGSHSHTISGTTDTNGSGSAHNNMPPYLTVSMWKRTA